MCTIHVGVSSTRGNSPVWESLPARKWFGADGITRAFEQERRSATATGESLHLFGAVCSVWNVQCAVCSVWTGSVYQGMPTSLCAVKVPELRECSVTSGSPLSCHQDPTSTWGDHTSSQDYPQSGTWGGSCRVPFGIHDALQFTWHWGQRCLRMFAWCMFVYVLVRVCYML